MLKEYVLHPEVPGELGQKTILNSARHPPEIRKLHFVFKTWLGDDLIECFPVFLISDKLRTSIEKTSLTGYSFREFEQSIDDYVHQSFQPEVDILHFNWMILGAQKKDFYIDGQSRLVVSENALNVLKAFNLNHCDIEENNLSGA